MPEISTFYGIRVTVNCRDHLPPHFHAVYNDDEVLIDLRDLSVYRGGLPRRALRLVQEWAAAHHDELKAVWAAAQAKQPLFKITPPSLKGACMYRVTEVTPGEGLTLRLTYGDGAVIHADVSGLLKGDPGVFAPLADRAFFERVVPGERGRSVTWPVAVGVPSLGDLDLDADVFRMNDGDPDKPDDIRTLSSAPPIPADPISLEVARALSESGLTQQVIAERTGMRQPNVARLADPTYHGHSVAALRRLAEALGQELEVRFVSKAS